LQQLLKPGDLGRIKLLKRQLKFRPDQQHRARAKEGTPRRAIARLNCQPDGRAAAGGAQLEIARFLIG
jgi:hypothetical protein